MDQLVIDDNNKIGINDNNNNNKNDNNQNKMNNDKNKTSKADIFFISIEYSFLFF